MTTWLHTAVLGTIIAATAAVGIAAAAIITADTGVAPKGDRLPVIADAGSYVTIETRQDGVSVLNRVELN
jgi:hypothetical protein